MSQTNILLESGTNELEIVEFFLDEPGEGGKPYRGYYGVNVAKVLEIIQMPKITSLPEVQDPSVLGAFNLRSQIIPLVDLALWLGKAPVEHREAPKVIVTEFNSVTTAFQVAGVNRIHRISWEEVEPPSKYVAMVSKSNITGVVKMENRIVFLLDLEHVVAKLNPSLAKPGNACARSGGAPGKKGARCGIMCRCWFRISKCPAWTAITSVSA